MKIDFDFIFGTPVFKSEDAHPDWARILGASLLPNEKYWIFPAFPPFRDNVIHDIQCVYPDAEFSESATKWLSDHTLCYKKNVTLSKNYEHQDEGLALILYNYRFALEWGMGTGKTKVILDAAHLLRCPTLVLCPLVAAENWESEKEKFLGDNLSLLVMRGSRSKKLETLKRAEHADMLIVPYDTAKIYGVPTLHAPTVKIFVDKQQSPTPRAQKYIATINDVGIQSRLANEWLKGRATRDMGEEVALLRAQLGPQWLIELPYTMIVADESHRLRRIESARTKVCLQLSAKSPRRYLLSGTLNLGDPRNLYPQLRFLAKYLMPDTWTEFCRKHVQVSPYNRHIVTGFTNLHVLNHKLTSVSHVKTLEECHDMPERTLQDVYFHLDDAQVTDYNRIVEENIMIRPDGSQYDIPNGGVRLSKLLQICSGFSYVPEHTEICDTCVNMELCVSKNIRPGSSKCIQNVELEREIIKYKYNPKLEALKDLQEDIWATSKPKSIIWAVLIEELNDIEEFLKSKKVNYIRVDGSNSSKIQKFNKEFQTNPECLVWLGQIATGISITLTEAIYMIYYSRDWSLDNWLQSQDRNYRIGQVNKTVVYRLCAKESVELAQLTALDARMDIKELLSKRIDCLTCPRYKICFKHNITPWSDLCVLPREKKRYVTEVQAIRKEEKDEDNTGRERCD